MKYQIEFASAAARAFRKLSPEVRHRLTRIIDALADEPRPDGVRKLTGSDDIYRVRTGDYRILYQIVDRALLIIVVDVGHRRDIYR